MNIDQLIQDIHNLFPQYSAFKTWSIVDRTFHTIKIIMVIERDMFVQIYANDSKDKLNLAFIQNNQRIYGVDSEGEILHEHPFDNPEDHIPIKEPVSLDTFLARVQDYCEKMNLL